MSLGSNKPMDIFAGWEDYVERLQAHWQQMVAEEDTVVLVGDTSWGMSLDECKKDFAFLQQLPGQKFLIKGNHDYWWTTAAKMTQYLETLGFSTLRFLHNNFVPCGSVALCGTRGWMMEPTQAHEAKIMAREVIRLKLSLEAACQWQKDAEKLVFLHYPPIHPGSFFPGIIEAMWQYGVKRCFYGHLHAQTIKKAIQGPVQGVDYTLISADALGFKPLEITCKR